MAIITDLEYIKEIAIEKEDENWGFRVYLKQHELTRREIDAIVHLITDDVTSKIDCKECANCCKQISPVLDGEDASIFAEGLNMPASEFIERYLSSENESSDKFTFIELPCPFLTNNLCSNYDRLPKDCRSFPHIHKKDFVSRLWGVVENYSVCLIVFNVYEQLKTELWHND